MRVLSTTLSMLGVNPPSDISEVAQKQKYSPSDRLITQDNVIFNLESIPADVSYQSNLLTDS